MFKKILVPTDFSASAKLALKLAQENFPSAQIKVLHVLDEDAPPVGATEALLQLEGLESEVVLGNPAQLLMETAITWGADLIVMGSEGKSGLGKPFFGSVAEWVVRESPIPVLTVRAPLARTNHVSSEQLKATLSNAK